MKDAQFMPAKEKETVLRQWKTFLKHGCKWEHFHKALYNHAIQHMSFIAHYNRLGFYETYFVKPETKRKFFSQFDRDRGCVSVEYGMRGWLTDPDYADINGALVDAAEPYLNKLYSEAHTDERQRDLTIAQSLCEKHGVPFNATV